MADPINEEDAQWWMRNGVPEPEVRAMQQRQREQAQANARLTAARAEELRLAAGPANPAHPASPLFAAAEGGEVWPWHVAALKVLGFMQSQLRLVGGGMGGLFCLGLDFAAAPQALLAAEVPPGEQAEVLRLVREMEPEVRRAFNRAARAAGSRAPAP